MTAPRPGERDEAGEGPDPHRWWALVVIALAQLMVVLDATIVTIALPSAQRELHISSGNRQWVITAYTLAFGGLLLLGGRVADFVGRKRTFVIGLCGFAVASGVGGAAQSSGMLFGARALQGVFAALLAPSALSLLSTTFQDPSERAKAFGVFSALAGSGAAIGLMAGGLLTDFLSWRWCLYVNIPIAIGTVAGALTLLHDRPGHEEARLDIPGVVLGCGGLVAIVYGFSEAQPRGWTSPFVLVLLAVGLAMLVFFVRWQTKAPHPLLPPHIIRERNRAGSFLAIVMATIGLFGLFLFLTFYMQTILGYSPLRTGLAFLPIAGAIVVGSTQISARLLPRTAPRNLVVPGMILAAGGLIILTQLTVEAAYVTHLLPAMLLLGLGIGLTFMPVMATATAGVAPWDAGVTSATVNTSQQVGGSIGTSLLNTIATSTASDYVRTHLRDPAQRTAVERAGVVHGYATAIWWAVVIMLIGAVVAGVLISGRGPQQPARREGRVPEPVR
ncbi:MFS transporter [Streptomyces sp. TS71-3]|uniref:MFS transporter n=1 Tax=Streptomyces sp. TS71-3 TaxID=2733862 RepID=UPI001B21B6B9|nr:MFS transporter [Streptomyces sp. TS71-3]GHJ34508.1 MFS transporter [Streptomyces sp. TS71-3]